MVSQIIRTIKDYLRGTYFYPSFLARKNLKKIILKNRKYLKGNTLDVGCGEKPYEGMFPNVTKYCGLDHPNSPARNLKADIRADACEMPISSDSYDSVICTEVIEHVPEPGKLLDECRRVLKDNGKLIISSPFIYGSHEIPNDYYRYSKYGLRYLVEKSGFKIEKLCQTTGSWGVAGVTLSAVVYEKFASPSNKILFRIPAYFLIFAIQMLFDILDCLACHKGNSVTHVIFASKRK